VRAEPARGARGVDRGVAAADDDDPVADIDLLADGHAVQEVDAGEAVRGVLTLESEVDALLGADCQVDRLVVAPQVSIETSPADLHAGAQLDAEVEDRLDLRVENLLGEAIARDAEAQHAAGLGEALEHGHGVAARARAGTRTRARPPPPTTATRSGSFSSTSFFARSLCWSPPVADPAFHAVDRHGRIELAAVAGALAGCGQTRPSWPGRGCGS